MLCSAISSCHFQLMQLLRAVSGLRATSCCGPPGVPLASFVFTLFATRRQVAGVVVDEVAVAVELGDAGRDVQCSVW